MKPASYSTMSFLRHSGITGLLFGWLFRHQSRDIFTQLINDRCRWFDFRIAFDKHNLPVFANGRYRLIPSWRYCNFSPYHVLQGLNSFPEPIFVRVVNEIPSTDIHAFRRFCKTIERDFPNITFHGGQNRKDWKQWYSFEKNGPLAVDRSSMEDDAPHLWRFCPRLYSLFHNRKHRERYKDSDIFLIQDFIGKY